jgi:hypothetical protein
MAATNKTSAATTRKLDRQFKALELRRMGKGYVEISSALGIGKSQAHRLVQAGLQDARAQVDAEANELKAEEISRLDAMLAGLWPDARKGHHSAVDRVLKIMERRARLLGLDAPQRMALGGHNGGPLQVRHDGLDLSTLTDAELDTIEAIAAAADARARTG